MPIAHEKVTGIQVLGHASAAMRDLVIRLPWLGAKPTIHDVVSSLARGEIMLFDPAANDQGDLLRAARSAAPTPLRP